MIKCEICEKELNVGGDPSKDGLALAAHMRTHESPKEKPKKATNLSLTPEQQAIAERISSAQANDFETIREDDLNDFSLMNNPFDLPPEAQKLQNEKVYAFRFCERTPDRIDFLTKSVAPPLQWKLVNKVTLPELGHLVDPIIGGVIVMDQILLYKPWSWHQMVKEAKQELANNRDRSGNLDGKKQAIESSIENVEAYTGKRYKIGSGDQVVTSEEMYSNLVA